MNESSLTKKGKCEILISNMRRRSLPSQSYHMRVNSYFLRDCKNNESIYSIGTIQNYFQLFSYILSKTQRVQSKRICKRAKKNLYSTHQCFPKINGKIGIEYHNFIAKLNIMARHQNHKNVWG